MYDKHNSNHKSTLTCDICGHDIWFLPEEAHNEHEARVVAISRHGWYHGKLGQSTKDICHDCWSHLDSISGRNQ